MKKLAIIGTGVAGMSAAYFLRDHYELAVFEKNDYIGGHTNTIDLKASNNQTATFDTGFMVFNEVTYPNFIKLLKNLDVSYTDSDMSFSVKHETKDIEYNGSSFSGLFSQRKNILNLSHWKMILQINRFFKESPSILSNLNFENISIRQYIEEQGFGLEFYEQFLVPMGSAVWSTAPGKMDDFPAKTLIRFFYNHGFMGLNTQHQWKTIIGGSRQYRNKLISKFNDSIRINCPVREVIQYENHCMVKTDFSEEKFDKVIIATHADEALKLLKNPMPEQESILKHFHYSKNIAIVHSDESVMPKLKSNWSAWNYICKPDESFTVYYMNKLQSISAPGNYFININGESHVSQDKIHKTIKYDHPLFTSAAVKAQLNLPIINHPKAPLNFCGSYFRYGFHEDALLSSVALCSAILGKDVL